MEWREGRTLLKAHELDYGRNPMRNPATPNGRRDVSKKGENDRPEDLVELLLNRIVDLNGCSTNAPAETFTEEVLLDVNVDGARYLLIRLPKSSKARVQLSPREQEIVRMVAMGHPNKIIAGVLSISSWTVCTHLRRIFAKLGVSSRAAMVSRLHELGKVDLRNVPATSRLGPEYASNSSHQPPGSPRFGRQVS
jgi:DNA-binding CsgD family transcriptional regulator